MAAWRSRGTGSPESVRTTRVGQFEDAAHVDPFRAHEQGELTGVLDRLLHERTSRMANPEISSFASANGPSMTRVFRR